MRRLTLSIVAAAAAAAALAPGAQAAPRAFYGVIPQSSPTVSDFERMGNGGVGTIRFLVNWSWIDPGPATGNENWAYVDELFLRAAQHHIKALPFVTGTPDWVARDLDGYDCSDCTHYAPRSQAALAAWREFLRRLVGRYGPGGRLWQAHPGIPYRPAHVWQVHNEQNSPTFYLPRPDVKRFAKLLKSAERAIHNQDPRAKIVLGGMFGTPLGGAGTGISAWNFLTKLYRVKGIKQTFDGVALHPYAGSLKLVRKQVALALRRVRRAGDGNVGLWITELGWASAGPKDNRLVVGRKGQAKKLHAAFRMFERRRRSWNVRTVNWYSWRDISGDGICAWCPHSGMLTKSGAGKPSWRAFRNLSGGR